MPRAAKVAHTETKYLHDTGVLVDKRSFVGLDGHQYLKGDDISRRRREVFERDGYKCKVCGAAVDWETGELDHIQGGLVGRHDDMSNLQTICAPCHRAKHLHTRFGEHRDA